MSGIGTTPAAKHLCPVCGDEYINTGYHAEACTGTRATSGVRTVPADQYHADALTDQPSLSASIASILCSQSPLHAWTQHPRLNPNFVREEEHHFDIGTAAHALLLEGRNAVSVIEAPDWRTKDAKTCREQARAEGRIPLLGKHWDEVEAMVKAAREQLADHPTLLTDGHAEQTLVWDEDGVTCRARLDWLRNDLTAIHDYKTATDAHHERWSKRSLFNHGYDLKCAFYLRGLERVTGAHAQWLWIVQEKTPPYVISVVKPGADVLTAGAAKVEFAINRWRECMRTGVWPGYSASIYEAELPAWADDAKWLVPEYQEAA